MDSEHKRVLRRSGAAVSDRCPLPLAVLFLSSDLEGSVRKRL